MRRAVTVVLTALLALLATPVTPALAASGARVVVIVGPVGSSTAHYKADADAVAAEARRYTPNVVKVYTPNATWAKVKAAAQGANVLVYLGHGNGWPSRYTPFQTVTKDGLGLDPGTGADSTRVVYYGEDYIRSSIRLAPNAVVLLYHLCYASGNTEPGLAVGSFADSRERVDNYGAGFIGAGARAVLAEGHPAHPAVSYVRQLFTTNRTMQAIFRAAPTYHGHVLGPYSSQRTPGLQYLLDPDSSAPSGFYRSLVGDLGLTATEAVFPGLARTDADPADFVVPGAAETNDAAGTRLFATAAAAADPAATPEATLADGTRLRVTAEAAPAADGTRILGVSVLGGTAKGFVRATALVPRDSTPVATWTLDHSATWLSPNGDGVGDGLVVSARFSESAAAVLAVKNAAGTTVKTLSATGDFARFAWDLKTSGGAVIRDGAYTWSLRASDTWANAPISRSGSFTVDTTAPSSSATRDATVGANGWLVSPTRMTLTAKDATSGVKSIYWRVNGGTVSGYSAPATVSTNGTVSFEYRAIDKAGIREAWKAVTLKIDTRAPSIALAASGTAGATEGTWRGPVTVTPTIKDPTSGIAANSVSVDGAPATALTATTVTVAGEGPHTVTVTSRDNAGNHRSATIALVIDTTAPTLAVPAAGVTPPTVTPNGDVASERITLPFTASEPGTYSAIVTGTDPTKVLRTITGPMAAGDAALTWDGRNTAGTPVRDGRYTVTITPRDLAGNPGEPATVTVDVYAALKAVTRTPALFFPQDGDTLAPKTRVSYTLLSPATVTLTVVDAGGSVVRTAMTDRAQAAGAHAWAWNGRNDAGVLVPRGQYRIVVRATNGVQSAGQRVSVTADAFRITTSVAAAARGKALRITAVTAEPLSRAPRVLVRQPGVRVWAVTMTKVSSTKWTALITPKKAGSAGTMSLTVRGTDTRGGTNSSTVRLVLR